ncbi:unnamed protein product [Adineta ricciae]|uniref:Protein kinase domain-containing protein n=1 Tax=Adineta ricciae TaxID=249248 RepID=A0A814ZT07_ADIRI|nr:unnamed protein product [Adineta ricciae]
MVNPVKKNFHSDGIVKKIKSYAKRKQIPLVITGEILGNEAGSMSSTYHGYLKFTNHTQLSVIVKYLSFKSVWNYVHIEELNNLNKTTCYSRIDSKNNEYFINTEQRQRIVTENWFPVEVYVLYKSYFCQELMPTSRIVSLNLSYFSFYERIEQNESEQTFFLIIKKLDNAISLRKHLQTSSNRLTLSAVQNLIYSILFSVLQLKQMSMIHLDLNVGNIFLLNNPNDQFAVRFIDFSIMKLIHKSQQIDEEIFINYSENLHQSLRSIFLNCPSCYTYPLPIFAQQYQPEFGSYFIEHLIYDPFFYLQENLHV